MSEKTKENRKKWSQEVNVNIFTLQMHAVREQLFIYLTCQYIADANMIIFYFKPQFISFYSMILENAWISLILT
jgi:hypothetical protein